MDKLYHYGVKGQKWGVRRYQNKNRTLTSAGKKRYKESYSDWEKAQNLADKKWDQVSSQYKSLGKNAVSRMINAAKGTSSEAKKYSKSYSDWEKSQNIADKKWDQVSENYKKLGKNRVSRILNAL